MVVFYSKLLLLFEKYQQQCSVGGWIYLYAINIPEFLYFLIAHFLQLIMIILPAAVFLWLVLLIGVVT